MFYLTTHSTHFIYGYLFKQGCTLRGGGGACRWGSCPLENLTFILINYFFTPKYNTEMSGFNFCSISLYVTSSDNIPEAKLNTPTRHCLYMTVHVNYQCINE